MKSSEYRESGSLWIHAARAILITIVIFCLASHLFGQSRSAAEVRGTVLDQQGAAIAGAAVTITNVLTGISQKFTTNEAGLYDAPAVPVGKYTITFEKAGFERFERSGISLDIEVITINATLKVGSIHETMTVTGEASMVETDSPQGTTTVSGTAVQDTTNVGHNWMTLLELLPGVTAGGYGQTLTGGNQSSASVNGAGQLQNEWQLDGVHSSGTDAPTPAIPVPLDDVEELKAVTSNFGAEYGNGVAVINVVTKSGTNDWHGNLYEYVQNDKLNALAYPNTTRTLAQWNEYGGTLGGPIVRNKAFFFVSIQRNPANASWMSQSNTPTDAMRGGDFSDPSLGGATPIYDPATISCNTANPPVCTERQFSYNGKLNVINPARISPVAQAIMNLFPEPNHPPTVAGTAEGSDNYWWVAKAPSYNDNYNFKVDYNINPGNRLTASLWYDPNGTASPNFPSPLDDYWWKQKGLGAGLADVWTFSPHVVGEFRLNATPGPGHGIQGGMGEGWPAKLGLLNPGADILPNLSIDGTSGTGLSAVYGVDDEGAVVLSGKLTWVKGKHILKSGGEFDRWYDDVGWPAKNEGNYDFSGLFSQNIANPVNTGLGWADFLLGMPDTWGNSANPVTGGRMYNLAAFAQDEYKIRPNLTLTLGLRWMVQSGWSEDQNRLADFDPTLVNPSPYPGSTQTLGAMWYAPQGGRHALENAVYDVVDPRVGFAWVPFRNWSIRGGYGIYDENWSGSNYFPGSDRGLGYGISQGLSANSNILTPIFTLSTPNASPYGWNGQVGAPPVVTLTAATRTPDALNGQGVFYALQKTPMAYVEQYRLDLEHEIKGSILIDVAYVGNSGHHYPFARDMNQIPEALLGTTNCTYLSNLQLCRPYPQYLGISALKNQEFGNYNGLQVTFRKQFANGLSFLTNYTWSHAMDTLTVGGQVGNVPAIWQNAYDVRGDYGAAMADQRQMLNGNLVYALPFGKGKPLLNQGGLLNSVVGGWELSSLFQFHTGLPFTPVMNGNFSYSQSGSWRPNQVGNPNSGGCPSVEADGSLGPPYTPVHTVNCWFNWTAYQEPAIYTYGNAKRNSIYGPGWKQVDMSLLKSFKIREKVNLQFKAEAFDVFNNNNWANPGCCGAVDIALSPVDNVGSNIISSSLTSRNLQFGFNLSF